MRKCNTCELKQRCPFNITHFGVRFCANRTIYKQELKKERLNRVKNRNKNKIKNEKKHKNIDNVNHPSHYTWLKDKCGIEVIDITRHMDFCLGNAIKYILRAGHKSDAFLSNRDKEIEDLKKAIFYINDKIKQL